MCTENLWSILVKPKRNNFNFDFDLDLPGWKDEEPIDYELDSMLMIKLSEESLSRVAASQDADEDQKERTPFCL